MKIANYSAKFALPLPFQCNAMHTDEKLHRCSRKKRNPKRNLTQAPLHWAFKLFNNITNGLKTINDLFALFCHKDALCSAGGWGAAHNTKSNRRICAIWWKGPLGSHYLPFFPSCFFVCFFFYFTIHLLYAGTRYRHTARHSLQVRRMHAAECLWQIFFSFSPIFFFHNALLCFQHESGKWQRHN